MMVLREMEASGESAVCQDAAANATGWWELTSGLGGPLGDR